MPTSEFTADQERAVVDGDAWPLKIAKAVAALVVIGVVALGANAVAKTNLDSASTGGRQGFQGGPPGVQGGGGNSQNGFPGASPGGQAPTAGQAPGGANPSGQSATPGGQGATGSTI